MQCCASPPHPLFLSLQLKFQRQGWLEHQQELTCSFSLSELSHAWNKLKTRAWGKAGVSNTAHGPHLAQGIFPAGSPVARQATGRGQGQWGVPYHKMWGPWPQMDMAVSSGRASKGCICTALICPTAA